MSFKPDAMKYITAAQQACLDQNHAMIKEAITALVTLAGVVQQRCESEVDAWTSVLGMTASAIQKLVRRTKAEELEAAITPEEQLKVEGEILEEISSFSIAMMSMLLLSKAEDVLSSAKFEKQAASGWQKVSELPEDRADRITRKIEQSEEIAEQLIKTAQLFRLMGHAPEDVWGHTAGIVADILSKYADETDIGHAVGMAVGLLAQMAIAAAQARPTVESSS